jgi:hypothetical protein
MVSRQVRLQRHVVARCSAHAGRAVIGGIMTGASITAAHLIDLVRSFPRQRGKRKTVASHTRGSEPDRFAGFRRATAFGAQPTASATNSNRRCAVSADLSDPVPSVRFDSSVTGRQLGFLAEHDPAATAWSGECRQRRLVRALTCRAPAEPRSCSMLSVYMAVRVRPFPKLPPLEQDGCGPSTLISPA